MIWTIKTLLEHGLQNIKKRGWCQEHAQNDKDEVCAWGAMRIAVDADQESPTSWASVYLVDDAAEYFESVNGINNIISWNDAPGRTQDEVIQAYEKTLAALDKAGQTG